MPVEPTWFGCVSSPRDTYILLEASRQGILPKVTRRLTDMERIRLIQPGACFVWEEAEAGIKRWTDSFKWSPSRVSGAFLIYSELPNDGQPGSGLYKQSFSSQTRDGSKMHLIAYYDKKSLDSGSLPVVSDDTRLQNIVIPPGIYPDQRATGLDQPMPKVFPTYTLPSVLQKGGSPGPNDDSSDSRPTSRSGAYGAFNAAPGPSMPLSTMHRSGSGSNMAFVGAEQQRVAESSQQAIRRASSSTYLPNYSLQSSMPGGRRPSAPKLETPHFRSPWTQIPIPSSNMIRNTEQNSQGSSNGSDRLPSLTSVLNNPPEPTSGPPYMPIAPHELPYPSRHSASHPAAILSNYSWSSSAQLPALPSTDPAIDAHIFGDRRLSHSTVDFRRGSIEEELARLPQSRSSEDNRQLDLLRSGLKL